MEILLPIKMNLHMSTWPHMHQFYTRTCFLSPAVGKVSKPRRGPPPGSVKDCRTRWVWFDCDWFVKNSGLPNSCILVHAYDALKGRPRKVRTVVSLY